MRDSGRLKGKLLSLFLLLLLFIYLIQFSSLMFADEEFIFFFSHPSKGGSCVVSLFTHKSHIFTKFHGCRLKSIALYVVYRKCLYMKVHNFVLL